MRGESYWWYRIAQATGRTVDEAQASVSNTGFLEWKEFFQFEEYRQTPLHYYLAQIASTFVRMNVKEPGKIKLTDYMLRFGDHDTDFADTPATPAATEDDSTAKKTKGDIARSVWGAILGAGGKLKTRTAPADRNKHTKPE